MEDLVAVSDVIHSTVFFLHSIFQKRTRQRLGFVSNGF